jgi:PKD repeat protein
LPFSALPAGGEPVVLVRWDFGDGVQTEGARVQHAWTQPGDYLVSVTAEGLDDMQSEQKCSVAVKGYLPSVFAPELNQRYQPQPK